MSYIHELVSQIEFLKQFPERERELINCILELIELQKDPAISELYPF